MDLVELRARSRARWVDPPLELARRVGVEPVVVELVLRGAIRPDPDLLVRMAAVLDDDVEP